MTVEQILSNEAETATNRYVPLLKRLMREQRPTDLQAAADMLSALPHDRDELGSAMSMIRAEMDRIVNAQEPRAVVAGGFESWYYGPRADDIDWPGLVLTLADSGWRQPALDALDEASSKIVAHLPNPAGTDPYLCRGLVLGYVQSGKTTNFTAVIAKASDAGYRMFIILSGMHEGLRQQTQDRLNDQLFEPNPARWRRLTDGQDFLPTYDVDATLAATQQRSLIVVKKNASRLRALERWLSRARPEQLERCPILIIDDEADQATPNTAKPDQQPKTINRLIRRITRTATRCAYVGYTATPFANVLIDPTDTEDLYPRDFIVDLPRPASYLGPESIFGRDPLNHDDDPDDGHDFIRPVPVDEINLLRPQGAAGRHDFRPAVTPSLDDALRYFLMSTAARRVRGGGNPHATALVHTSQHVEPHRMTAEVIRIRLALIAGRLDNEEPGLLDELRAQWSTECDRVPAADFDVPPIGFDDLAPRLAGIAREAVVITDNSRSEERLSFDDENPRVIVAVGGNTLSRGLTLEGLAVSYFVRTASAYDTLLQMGRWFGYRAGYADLTRIWMTEEMREWFRHLALVEAEIRDDISAYETDHLTPEEFAPRIRTHPQLAIAAASKMRAARPAEVSYSGKRLQTILFNHHDRDWLSANLTAGRDLLQNIIGTGGAGRHPRTGMTVWSGVDLAPVLTFLSAYRFHENSRGLNAQLISEYLNRAATRGHLNGFTVALLGRHPVLPELGDEQLVPGVRTGLINRAPLKGPPDRTYADIKALMSRDDRVVDLDPPTIPAGLELGDVERLRNTPDRGGRGDGSALLALYPISPHSRPATPKSARTRRRLGADVTVLGVGLVFPSSPEVSVDYMTADLTGLSVEVEYPDEDDLPDDDLAAS